MIHRSHLILTIALLVGCSNGPERFEAPGVDVESAAAKALELYDKDTDGSLNKDELAACPAVLARFDIYDADTDGTVEASELKQRLERMLNRTGGTPLTAVVSYKGKKLSGANVVMEPEPYLGTEVQSATGTTNGSGSAVMTIPPEFMPEQLRRHKMVHYGTFKVRVTHPVITIPAKYNAETELGYETEPGNPLAYFNLN
jgi:hypothetical protein